MLTPTEIERYSRQLILKNWTTTTQLNLKNQHVLVPDSLPSAYIYLAAAGIGHLSLYSTQPQPLNPWILPHTQNLNPEITSLLWPNNLSQPLTCQVIINSSPKPNLASPPPTTITIDPTQPTLSIATQTETTILEFPLTFQLSDLSFGCMTAMSIIKYL